MDLCSLFEEELAEALCTPVPSSSFPGCTRIHSRFLLGESEKIVSCQDDFEKLKDIVAPAGNLAIDHLNHVVSGLNTAGIYLLSFQFQNFLWSCLLIIIPKLQHTMFTNISTGTSAKISHYHIIWYLTSDYLLHEQRKLPLAISLGRLHIWSIIPIFNCKHYFFLNHIFFYLFHWISFHNKKN